MPIKRLELCSVFTVTDFFTNHAPAHRVYFMEVPDAWGVLVLCCQLHDVAVQMGSSLGKEVFQIVWWLD